MAVRGPPGGVGDEGRPMLEPEAAPAALAGEEARGEDFKYQLVSRSRDSAALNSMSQIPERHEGAVRLQID